MTYEKRRVLVVESPRGDLGIDQPAALRALGWAEIDKIVSVRALPMDRRHNSKIDYGALAAMIEAPQR